MAGYPNGYPAKNTFFYEKKNIAAAYTDHHLFYHLLIDFPELGAY